jgi:hypothetical protein
MQKTYFQKNEQNTLVTVKMQKGRTTNMQRKDRTFCALEAGTPVEGLKGNSDKMGFETQSRRVIHQWMTAYSVDKVACLGRKIGTRVKSSSCTFWTWCRNIIRHRSLPREQDGKTPTFKTQQQGHSSNDAG